jgi:hypothetical protein
MMTHKTVSKRIRASSALFGLLALGSCMIVDREQVYYTRSDIDAITAGIECRHLARDLVQIARCDTTRR